MLSDGTRTFRRDGGNRLSKVTIDDADTHFAHGQDGRGWRRAGEFTSTHPSVDVEIEAITKNCA